MYLLSFEFSDILQCSFQLLEPSECFKQTQKLSSVILSCNALSDPIYIFIIQKIKKRERSLLIYKISNNTYQINISLLLNSHLSLIYAIIYYDLQLFIENFVIFLFCFFLYLTFFAPRSEVTLLHLCS